MSFEKMITNQYNVHLNSIMYKYLRKTVKSVFNVFIFEQLGKYLDATLYVMHYARLLKEQGSVKLSKSFIEPGLSQGNQCKQICRYLCLHRLSRQRETKKKVRRGNNFPSDFQDEGYAFIFRRHDRGRHLLAKLFVMSLFIYGFWSPSGNAHQFRSSCRVNLLNSMVQKKSHKRLSS